MREATVQASSCLASRLDAKNLNGTLLRFVKKLLVRQLLQAGQLHDNPPWFDAWCVCVCVCLCVRVTWRSPTQRGPSASTLSSCWAASLPCCVPIPGMRYVLAMVANMPHTHTTLALLACVPVVSLCRCTQEVMGAFAKAMRDPFGHVRLAAVRGIQATYKGFNSVVRQ